MTSLPATGPLPGPTRAMQVFEAVTVGLPFAAFKILAGLVLMHAIDDVVAAGASVSVVAGYALVALGAVDALLNLVNAVALAIPRAGRRVLPVCALQLVLAPVGAAVRADVGAAADVLFSFALVAAVIASGSIGTLASLSPHALTAWNAAVICNVLGAGVLRLAQALTRERMTR